MSANSRLTVAVHAATLLHGAGEEWTKSDRIAGSIGTHPVVVRRVIGRLVEDGWVETMPGPTGGYRLAKSGDEVTLWDLYLSTREDGPFALHAGEPNPNCPVGSCISTHLGGIYREAEHAMQSVLGTVTIAGLARRIQTKSVEI